MDEGQVRERLDIAHQGRVSGDTFLEHPWWLVGRFGRSAVSNT